MILFSQTAQKWFYETVQFTKKIKKQPKRMRNLKIWNVDNLIIALSILFREKTKSNRAKTAVDLEYRAPLLLQPRWWYGSRHLHFRWWSTFRLHFTFVAVMRNVPYFILWTEFHCLVWIIWFLVYLGIGYHVHCVFLSWFSVWIS